jgi:hypothetical protein
VAAFARIRSLIDKPPLPLSPKNQFWKGVLWLALENGKHMSRNRPSRRGKSRLPIDISISKGAHANAAAAAVLVLVLVVLLAVVVVVVDAAAAAVVVVAVAAAVVVVVVVAIAAASVLFCCSYMLLKWPWCCGL